MKLRLVELLPALLLLSALVGAAQPAEDATPSYTMTIVK